MLVGRHWVPALVTGALATVLIVPNVPAASNSFDEEQYAWSAGYYGKKVLAGDFERRGRDVFADPGWDPDSYWGRSTGTRAILALGLATPWAVAPSQPYSYTDHMRQGAETRLDRRSRVTLRIVAALCAVVGAMLLALRFRWAGAFAGAAVLSVPQNAENFARAWAEGPLLFAFGLIAISFGSRWFPLVLGAASTVKLTAVALWPLVFVRHAHPWRSRVVALAATTATWVLLTPPSWYFGGPGLLLRLGGMRVTEYSAGQGPDGGVLFVPARYVWPFELAGALIVSALLGRTTLAQRVKALPTRVRTAGATLRGESDEGSNGTGDRTGPTASRRWVSRPWRRSSR